MELEQAHERILSLIQPLPPESVPLSGAAGRILAETVRADHDLPPFDNSAMDGYAVRAADLAGATAERPVPLRLIGQGAAGQVFAGEVAGGQCVRVFTGSPLPRGADAVIMQEGTRVVPAEPDHPRMLESVKPWENVRFRGEDVKAGSLLLQAGERLTPGQIGLLAATGRSLVLAGRRPVVGLVATGSELREPGGALGPGQIYESNRMTLAALADRAGARPHLYPLVADDLAAIRTTLESAFRECDVVVTSGGVSVGELDLVKASFQQMGGELDFWRVAVKPGRPFAFGIWESKLLFGLPGNPVSAFVTFVLLVAPALLRFQGANRTSPPQRTGSLAEPLANPGDRRHFVRVQLNEAGQIQPSGTQASHLLVSLAAADGLVDVPPRTVLPVGTTMPVVSW